MKPKLALVISSICFSLASFVSAAELQAPAVIRDEDFHAIVRPITLGGLKQQGTLETDSFKVVEGIGTETLTLQDPDKALHGATVLYHLEKARRFYLEKFNSDYIRAYPQVVVRIEMPQDFNETGHFVNAAVSQSYNNALSIPSSGEMRGGQFPEWGPEIWFRPRKNVEAESSLALATKAMNSWAFKSVIYSTLLRTYSIDVAHSLIHGNLSANQLKTYVIGLGGFEATTRTLAFLFKNSKTTVYSDTALIPEVIYHEYSHHMLSDTIRMDDVDTSTPLAEGYADYFAARIADHSKLADDIKSYSNFGAKNGDKEQKYHPALNQKYNAQTDFVFSLLWGLNETFEPSFADQLIYQAHFFLDSRSDVRHDLGHALVKACQEALQCGFQKKIQLIEYLQSRGL